MRTLRWLGIAVGVLLILIYLGHRSGNQPQRDAVDAARRELGVDFQSRFVDLGQVKLHVVTAGPESGPPVVLLHGFPEFWYAWYRQMGELAKAGFRVIAPDQRGYNLSSKPGAIEDYRIDTLAADVAALTETLGYDKIFLAAHDWGGGVAWRFAIDHPSRVRKMVIIDTPHPQAGRDFESKDETVNWFRTAFQIPWLPEWIVRLGNWRMLSNTLRESSRPGAFPEAKLDLYRSAWDNDGAVSTMIDWYRAAYRYPMPYPEEKRLSIPILIVVSPHDAFIPADLTRASLRYLDNGRVMELQEGTHWILQEEPERTSKILIDFFSE